MIVVMIWAVAVSALAAYGVYVWLGLQGVSLWKLWPLLVYVTWAQFWLWRGEFRNPN